MPAMLPRFGEIAFIYPPIYALRPRRWPSARNDARASDDEPRP